MKCNILNNKHCEQKKINSMLNMLSLWPLDLFEKYKYILVKFLRYYRIVNSIAIIGGCRCS